MRWDHLATRVLEGAPPSREEALAVVGSDDDELLAVLHAAFRVRRHFWGRDVVVQVLHNAKSGVCPEDCGFCSQSARAGSDVPRHAMVPTDEIIAGAQEALALGAVRYCVATSTRRPSERDLEVLCQAVRRIKGETPLSVCLSVGMLSEAVCARLREAGVDRINHNLETSRGNFKNVVTTHTYDDRVATIRAAQAAGLEVCCGGIVGLGETPEDRVDQAFELAALDVDALPVNFLDPRPGTAMADRPRPSPGDCLRALALFRLVHPRTDLRVAGGRETCLRSQQPLALYAANSLFTRGYLTTPGQGHEADLAMIRDAGFRVARVEPA